MPFTVKKLEIPEVVLIEQKTFADHRGLFKETFKFSDFKDLGLPANFVQDSFSLSAQNTLRGLHYQNNPKPQGKYVYCLKGKIFDVAVDVRKNSPTFARWVGVELSEENHHAIYLPPGFAHGFLALSEEAYVAYKLTDEYDPQLEQGILWNDPQLNIQWPVDNPILSEKDKKNPLLKDVDIQFS